MTAPFDTALMADTSARLYDTLRKDLLSLADTHGDSFTASVAANIAIDLLVTVIAGAPSDEARLLTIIGIMTTLSGNLKREMAGVEAEDLIARAMQKARAS
jgi:hypothetical protein